MSPNEKSARLAAIAAGLRKFQREAEKLDERMLGDLIAKAAEEARAAADQAIVQA